MQASHEFRDLVLAYVKKNYSVLPDAPWSKNPENLVLRHRGEHGKWFGLLMTIERRHLGLRAQGEAGSVIDALNVKAEPTVVVALTSQPGIFPAYHMNKVHWITVALDGSVDMAQIEELLDSSFDLTAPAATPKMI